MTRDEANTINPFIEFRTADTINAVAAGLNALRAMRIGDECALNDTAEYGMFLILGAMEYALKFETREKQS